MVKKEAAKDKKGTSKPAGDVKKQPAIASVPESEGFNLVAFAVGAKEELAKVVWPSRQQLLSESAAVLLMVSLSAGIIYFVDKFLSWASTQVFG